MQDNTTRGSCLCGAVSFEICAPYNAFRYCHCSRCQKASGSAHAANLFVPPGQFRWLTGTEQIGKFDLPEAKRFSVWFCQHCGSRTPHLLRDGGTLVPAGLLDTDPGARPENNIYWGSRACWYDEPETMPKFAERP